MGGSPEAQRGTRGQRCTHRAKGCAGGLHHSTPCTSLSCQPHEPGAAHFAAPRWDGGFLLIPVQTAQGLATSTRAKTEPGGDTGASWDLPPSSSGGTGCGGRDGVPWGWEQSHRELGASAAAQGQEQKGGSGTGQEDVSSCVMRAPRRVQLVRHASCPAQMSCRQRGRGSGRPGSPAQGSAAEATSSHRALLLGSTAKDPPAEQPRAGCTALGMPGCRS